jgi:hypothetical protein
MEKYNFNTTVGMFGELNLDSNDWVNKEQKDFYFKRNKFQNTKQLVKYYPKYLDEIYIQCANGHVFTPKWLEKRPPLMPLRMRDGQLLQPISAVTPCTSCNELTDIKLPVNQQYIGDCHLYGDEAIRDFNKKIIMSYTLVAQPRKEEIHREFKAKFLALKKELVPSLPAKSWTLHYMVLMNRGLRMKEKHLAHLTKNNVLEFSQKLGELISNYPNQLVKWNCSGVYEKPVQYKKKEMQELKSRVYYPLIGRVITEHTDSGISPHIHFEGTNDDGWAKNLFNGGRLTLMWAFISRMLPVPNPTFHPPSDSIYLEIADFISFVIARYLFVVGKRAEGEHLEFECLPSWLGEIRYLGYTNTGTCLFETESEYPLENFFNGTIWYPQKD